MKKTYASENLPPAFPEAASRRQVAPLWQRGVIPPFCKGRKGGISSFVSIYYGLIKKSMCDDRRLHAMGVVFNELWKTGLF